MLFLIQVFVLAGICWMLFFAVFGNSPVNGQSTTRDSCDSDEAIDRHAADLRDVISVRSCFNWGRHTFEGYKYRKTLTAIDYAVRLVSTPLVYVGAVICAFCWGFLFYKENTGSNYHDEAIERRTTENVYDHAGRDITSEEDRFLANVDDEIQSSLDYEQHHQSFEDDNRPF